MKTQTTILEQTIEDLVNLLSTALYGSSYLSADYDELEGKDVGDCYEEVMARILLDGGRISITDHYAEDGEVYGNLSCKVDEDEDGYLTTTYYVTLEDILSGLEKAADGTFSTRPDVSADYADRNVEFARRSFNAFAFDERSWDAIAADCLMQIILFDEIVYG